MDIRNGHIHLSSFVEELKKTERNEELKFFKEMKIDPTERQLSRKPPRVGRNEPCPCGSGKKFKKCCLL